MAVRLNQRLFAIESQRVVASVKRDTLSSSYSIWLNSGILLQSACVASPVFGSQIPDIATMKLGSNAGSAECLTSRAGVRTYMRT